MNSQKVDNQLNLALDSTLKEREKSLDLNIGFNVETGTWDLILKYSGDLTEIEENLFASITYLRNGYAIVTIKEEYIDELIKYPQVEFIEKPKGLYWEQQEALLESCIYQVKRPPYSLDGSGVIVAVLDSGIDYQHPEFLKEDGTTRLVGLWDQTIQGNPPKGYKIGTFFSENEINQALQSNDPFNIVPTTDLSGHGTHVAGICAGNQGVASKSDILVVKLGNRGRRSFPRTTELMEAVNFCIDYSLEKRQPLVINLSFGNNYGGHDGSSLLETFLDDVSFIGKTSIVCGSGNEGANQRHAGGTVKPMERKEIELSISEYEPSINLQLWKSYTDGFGIYLTDPSNRRIGPVNQVLGTQRFILGNTKILIYFGEPAPYNRDQEIYIEWIPVGDYIDSGIWTVELLGEKIVTGRYNMWLPVAETTGNLSRFLFPDESTTLTIPSTAKKVITVGAYDAEIDGVAFFSGRGFTRTNEIKPDLVAPGVNILSANTGGGYSMRSGTSMATPFVAGSVALLMEYGIIDGNDPYLYGEKVKAYLLRGANKLPVMEQYPNPILGYGTLCLKDSLPF